MNGSFPDATASGRGASGDSCDKSSSQAKNRRNGRRCSVPCSRMVPRSIGERASRASRTDRCVTAPVTSISTSPLTWASIRRWGGSMRRIIISGSISLFKHLIPVMRVPPDLLDIESDPAAEVDWRIFLGHAEGLEMFECLKRSAVVAHIFETPLNDDEVLENLGRRAPVPMVLMARPGAGQPVLRPELVNRPGFTVIAGPDAGLGAFVGRQGVVDVGDFMRHLGPSKLVSHRLRQPRLVSNLSLGGSDAYGVLIGQQTFWGQHPRGQRNGGKWRPDDHGDHGGTRPRGAGRQPALDDDCTAGEKHWINREYVIVLGVRDFHQHKEDRK